MKPLFDSLFPGLATALNVEEMTVLLNDALANHHPSLEAKEGKILDVKYTPGIEGIFLYRFKLKGRSSRMSQKHLITGVLMKEGESEPPQMEWRDVLKYPDSSKALLNYPILYLSNPKILLCIFPYDRLMPWLGNLLNGFFVKECLKKIRIRTNPVLKKITCDLLGYTPELRAVFSYSFETGKSKAELIGKTSSYKIPEVLFMDQWVLWKTCESRVALAKPEGYLSNPPLFLQQRVPGKRLGSMLNDPSFDALLRETARSISTIHRTIIPLNKKRDPFRETQSLRRWSAVLPNLHSGLTMRIQKLQQSLLQEMESRTIVSATVHGDFHLTNVMVDRSMIYLIDFDQLASGDPSADIGRFVASLSNLSLRSYGNLYSLKTAESHFLEEYLQTCSGNLASIRLFQSASLVTTAASAFRVQREGWQEQALLLLEEAERVFDSARVRTSIPVRVAKKVSLKFEERKKWLSDASYMTAAVGKLLRKSGEVNILHCEIIQEEESDWGCRVLYRIGGQKDNSPWDCRMEGLLPRHGRKRTFYNQLLATHEAAAQATGVISSKPEYLSTIGVTVRIHSHSSGLVFSD